MHDVDVLSPTSRGRIRWRRRARRRERVRWRRGAGAAARKQRDTRVARAGSRNREWLHDVLQPARTKIAPARNGSDFGWGAHAELGTVFSGMGVL